MEKRMDARGVVPEKSRGTVEQYRRTYRQKAERLGLALRRKATVEELIEDFVESHERFAKATIGFYRASLRQLLEDGATTGALDAVTVAAFAARLEDGPRPLIGGRKNTSARKVKAITGSEATKLIGHLASSTRSFDKMVALYVYFTVAFFPRPVEWAGARLDEQRLELTFQNAKHSNGRAHSQSRSFNVDRLSDGDRENLRLLLEALDTERVRRGSIAALNKAIASAITRACRRCKLRLIAPTSLRHSGMASAKLVNSIRIVAYMAGHASGVTAGRHYAKARQGLKLKISVQVADEVGSVRITRLEKATRPTMRPKTKLRS